MFLRKDAGNPSPEVVLVVILWNDTSDTRLSPFSVSTRDFNPSIRTSIDSYSPFGYLVFGMHSLFFSIFDI
ncbi:hypothetical protein Hdeb2414_s0007g00248031 [Helianthus debilis subsp. tardiflorus]